MSLFELPYLHELTNMYKTRFGYAVIEKCELYRGVYIRNRVVARLDILRMVKGVVDDEIFKKYRSMIFRLMSGMLKDDEVISKVMSELYVCDRTFKNYLGELYYFDSDTDKKSLYRIMIERFKKEYLDAEDYVLGSLNTQRAKILFESEGYDYIAVKDEYGSLYLQEEIEMEVLSHGKIWDNKVERYKSKL